jgi:hypothetical protein
LVSKRACLLPRLSGYETGIFFIQHCKGVADNILPAKKKEKKTKI